MSPRAEKLEKLDLRTSSREVLTARDEFQVRRLPVDVHGDCWVWNKYVNAVTGYGKTGMAAYNKCPLTSSTYPHIIAWCLHHEASVPPGHEVDHTCFVRACVQESPLRDAAILLPQGFACRHDFVRVPEALLPRCGDVALFVLRVRNGYYRSITLNYSYHFVPFILASPWSFILEFGRARAMLYLVSSQMGVYRSEGPCLRSQIESHL